MKKLRMKRKERRKWKPRLTEKMRNTMLNTSRYELVATIS
jgi:hypothetical protein